MKRNTYSKSGTNKSIFFLLSFLILMGLYCIPLNVSSAVTAPSEVWARGLAYAPVSVNGHDVAIDGDSVYLVGTIYTLHQSAFIQKYDTEGNLIWTKLWNSSIGDGEFNAVAVHNNRIYVVGYLRNGTADTDTLLVCYNTTGDQQWNRTWGREATYSDSLNDIAIYDSDSIYVAGYSVNASTKQFALLMKYNSSGHLIWYEIWGTTTCTSLANGVAIYGANAIYICGQTSLYDISYDLLLVRYNSGGTMIWNLTWGGGTTDVGAGVVTDTAHNIYAVGRTTSFGPSSTEGFIAKFESTAGQKLWHSTFNEGLASQGHGITIGTDGYLYVVGSRVEAPILKDVEDILIAQYDSSGNKQWSTIWGITTDNDEVGYGIAVSGTDFLYIAGYAEYGSSENMAILVQFYMGQPSPGGVLFLLILFPLIGLGFVLVLVYLKRDVIFD